MKDKLKILLDNLTEQEKSEALASVIELLTDEKANLTISEAANYTGIGQHKLRELTDKENTDFPHFRVGSKVLINKQLLDKWLVEISQKNIVI